MHIKARALRVERGGRRIFANLSFSLASGEALLVTGPNGAGKSTLLRALAGLLPLAAGEIALERSGDLEPPGDLELAVLCHYVGHADALKASLTVVENLAFWSAMLAIAGRAHEPRFGGAAPIHLDAALARLGLDHIADLPAAYLSAGQKRRAALARLLTVQRPMWLLDEPLTALDAAAQTGLTALIKAHLAAGGMLIAATHAPLEIGARKLELGGRA
ncbi:MAG: heme ABC exporter ATP-binding protein CcmA [Beijerinckiaceae bacterium]